MAVKTPTDKPSRQAVPFRVIDADGAAGGEL